MDVPVGPLDALDLACVVTGNREAWDHPGLRALRRNLNEAMQADTRDDRHGHLAVKDALRTFNKMIPCRHGGPLWPDQQQAAVNALAEIAHEAPHQADEKPMAFLIRRIHSLWQVADKRGEQLYYQIKAAGPRMAVPAEWTMSKWDEVNAPASEAEMEGIPFDAPAPPYDEDTYQPDPVLCAAESIQRALERERRERLEASRRRAQPTSSLHDLPARRAA